MNDMAIRVERLGKMYRIGGVRESYKTLRDSLVGVVTNSIRRLRGRQHTSCKLETIWALKDVSFDIKRGEIVGIIGPNGAGKSSLLKILSHITEPTEGRAVIRGRVGSLLEVGTGFHPELTGRENIYLNGAILGMKKGEIDLKFDEIVAFAEVEKFIDTPIKHYSSGMYLRLAFAVAAHLEAEILLVDEVLAVGDVTFQKRCLGKMKNVVGEGRTVLFVSHNMSAIRSLCERTLLLENGSLKLDDISQKVVQKYLSEGNFAISEKIWKEEERPGNRSYKLNSICLRNSGGERVSSVNLSEEVLFDIYYEVIVDRTQVSFALTLFDSEGSCVFSSLNNTEKYFYGKMLQKGQYITRCYIYGNLLNAGRYFVSIAGFSASWSDKFLVEHAVSFDAIDDGVLKGDYFGNYGGVIRPKLLWETKHIGDYREKSEGS